MTTGVYKRGNIYWIRYAGLDGRMVFKSSGSKKFADAQKLVNEKRSLVNKGQEPEVKKIPKYTFRKLADDYLDWAQTTKSYKTKIYLISQLAEQYGNHYLRHFDKKMLERFQTERLLKGNKPATVNRFLSCLSHMFQKAQDWKMVEECVTKEVRSVKSLPEENQRLRYLSIEECYRLLDCCKPHLRPIVLTMLHTGMRKGEILSLKWEQIDLKHGFVLLERTKNGERREIPISSTLNETLLNLPRNINVPYVFYDEKTLKPYKEIKRSFATACRMARIDNFKPHDCRHTYASQMIMSGCDLTTLRSLLGHKDIKMTLRYAHLAPSHKTKAIAALDKAFNPKTTIQSTIQL